LKLIWRYIPEDASIHNQRWDNFKSFNFISTPAVRTSYTNIDSSVGIGTGCGLNSRRIGIRVPAETRVYFAPRGPDHINEGVQIRTRYEILLKGLLDILRRNGSIGMIICWWWKTGTNTELPYLTSTLNKVRCKSMPLQINEEWIAQNRFTLWSAELWDSETVSQPRRPQCESSLPTKHLTSYGTEQKTVSQPRRPQCESSLPTKHLISYGTEQKTVLQPRRPEGETSLPIVGVFLLSLSS
jgi:hypothetical protein